jgi:RNA polymerase sigma-70 factor (ECF subfamily)
MVGRFLYVQAGIAVGNLASIVGIRPEEAAILVELKAGSEEAFAWLIAQYQQPIYSLIARTVQDPADAPDVTQDVFIKVFRGIAGFHGDSSLRTWIYRIALHEASNRRRWWSRHCRQQITIEAEIGQTSAGRPVCLKDTLADEHESPFDQAAHQEIRARVEAELRSVPEPFRTTVVLRDIEGFSYEEIAEILNLNLGTVKSRLMRGRAHLKIRLAPYMEAARPLAGHPLAGAPPASQPLRYGAKQEA